MEANTSNTAQEQRIRKVVTKSPLEVTRVHATAYQKEGTLTAEIKQTITTKSYYPSKSVSNNMQDNPFSNADFGFSEQEYTSEEKRVAWVDVPVGSTVESVVAKLATLPTASIRKVLANKPIITDSQNYAIGAGLTSMEAIADKQVVRYPDNHPQAGQLILHNGKPQYKATYFKNVAVEDEDLRTADPADFYQTPAMRVELAGITTSFSVNQDSM
jgi:hypothetical protein